MTDPKDSSPGLRVKSSRVTHTGYIQVPVGGMRVGFETCTSQAIDSWLISGSLKRERPPGARSGTLVRKKVGWCESISCEMLLDQESVGIRQVF